MLDSGSSSASAEATGAGSECPLVADVEGAEEDCGGSEEGVGPPGMVLPAGFTPGPR